MRSSRVASKSLRSFTGVFRVAQRQGRGIRPAPSAQRVTAPFIVSARQLQTACLDINSVPRNGLQAACTGLLQRRAFTSSQGTQSLIEDGDKVAVHYKGTFPDSGDVFDSSEGKAPFEFRLGWNEVIPGMEQNIQGLRVGEKKSFTLSPDEGYGPRQEQLLIKVDKERVPEGVEVGSQLSLANGMPVKVTEVQEKTVVIDANHQLAGKSLHFDVEVVGVTKKADLPAEVTPVKETKAGDGKTFAQPGNTVTVHYVGMLAKDHSVFDSSRERDSPFSFRIGIGQVIAGWEEGIRNMSLGQRAELHIPAEKGYGAQGAGNIIPPNSDLIFDVEILKIE